MKENIIDLQEDVVIKQKDKRVILEKGDKIRILSMMEDASQYMPQTKDWERMLDLVLAGKDGDSVAKSIKDKKKAVARYIAGSKLGNSNLFSSFYDKAIELGATADEINQALNSVTIPDDIAEKYMNLKNKKLDNVYVSAISKEILKLGFDINFLSKGGNALTSQGKQSMKRNGRKWTIGYKTEIIVNDKKVDFSFDAITDEGGGTTFYAISTFDNKVVSSTALGQRELLTWLRNELNTL